MGIILAVSIGTLGTLSSCSKTQNGTIKAVHSKHLKLCQQSANGLEKILAR